MGITSLSFLDNSCRTTFLSRLGAERGLQVDAESLAQEQVTWEDFSRIMAAAFGHQVTDGDIHTKIEYHTRPG